MPAIDSYSAILILLQQIANKCDVIEGKLTALVAASNGRFSDDAMDSDDDATQEWEGSAPGPKASSSQTASKSSSVSK